MELGFLGSSAFCAMMAIPIQLWLTVFVWSVFAPDPSL